MSLNTDFYFRMFMRVKKSPSGCMKSLIKYSQVHQCRECQSFWLQPLGTESSPNKFKAASVSAPQKCLTCDSNIAINGPIWNQRLHNIDFCRKVKDSLDNRNYFDALKTSDRIKLTLQNIIDEEPLQDQPLNYRIGSLCKDISASVPHKSTFLYSLNQYGYRAFQTYYNPDRWKTDAPPEVLYDIMKHTKWHDN